jgi:peptidoglycan/xylan/chitin deacetylase (PgdA/CDA1 family)
MYHSISSLENDVNMMGTPPERFEAQMLYLKRRNLRGVSMRELLRAKSAGDTKGLVGLTFDDGYEDFLHSAVPVLERLGFSATVFVLVGMLGRANDWEHASNPRPRLKLLKVDHLREVSERGMEIGSHGMTHTNLLGLEPRLLDWEVNDSRRMLCEILSLAVDGFCYPYGSLDDAAVQAVRRAGYAYACGWRTQIDHDNYDLLRAPISQRDGPLRLSAKLTAYPQYSRVTSYIR